MITLRNKETGQELGSITEEQLKFLIDQMEEESSEDTDYWLPRAQIDVFRDAGADTALLQLLESALGDNEDIEIQWVRS